MARTFCAFEASTIFIRFCFSTGDHLFSILRGLRLPAAVLYLATTDVLRMTCSTGSATQLHGCIMRCKGTAHLAPMVPSNGLVRRGGFHDLVHFRDGLAEAHGLHPAGKRHGTREHA